MKNEQVRTVGQRAIVALSLTAVMLTASTGALAQELAAAVLPGSRSVQVGDTATVFATIVNAGSVTARDCDISLATAVPVAFDFQTTERFSNGVSGAANRALDIGARQSQSFVLSLTPSAAFPATDVVFSFDCANTPAVPVLPGINTLSLAASDLPAPDMVALSATHANDGIVETLAGTGSGAFAVASVNVGAGGNITASAEVDDDAPPVILGICETNRDTGQCLSPPASKVAIVAEPNSTPTFALFVTSASDIPFDPAHHRIVVRLIDSDGALRGSTSVAVRGVGHASGRGAVRIVAPVDAVDRDAGILTVLGISVMVIDTTRFKGRQGMDLNRLDDVVVGDWVRLRGVILHGGVIATRVEPQRSQDRVRLRGPVDTFVPETGTLEILGVEVTTTSDTRFKDQRNQRITEEEFFALLEEGQIVQVQGTLADGAIIAREIEVEIGDARDRGDDTDSDSDSDDDKVRSGRVRIEAFVDAVDMESGTVTLLGINALVNPDARLNAIQIGGWLRVDGLPQGDAVMATHVDRRSARDRVRLRGPVDTFDAAAGTLSILGVTIVTGSGTQFEDRRDNRLSVDAFFDALAPGTTVQAQGSFSDGTIVAQEVEFED